MLQPELLAKGDPYPLYWFSLNEVVGIAGVVVVAEIGGVMVTVTLSSP